MLTWLTNRIYSTLFLSMPKLTFGAEAIEAFEQHWQASLSTPQEPIDYRLKSPRWQFLAYLVREKGLLLHGSNRSDIERLVPQKQTDFNGKSVEAVFATRDPVWSIFFATLDMSVYRGSLRNGCWVVGDGEKERRYYFFALNESMFKQDVWTEGMVYILPGDRFEQADKRAVRFDEWLSRDAVAPLGRLPVSPDDFPFLGQVASFPPGEPMWLSWLKYKRSLRIRQGDSS